MQGLYKLGRENKFSISTQKKKKTNLNFFLENKSSTDRNSTNCAKVDKHGTLLDPFICS